MSQDQPFQTQQEIEEIAERLMRQISGILDRQQRSYALAKKLAQYPAPTILEIFRIITRRAQRKDPAYQDGFRTISDVRRLSRYIGYGKMSEIYSLARSKDYPEVVRFMQMTPPARKLGENEELEEDPVLKEMTLGTKRQKARMRDRDLIDRLCLEQDPVIIYNLLKNPVLTIREVVRIASKRPTSEKVLWTVYQDLKWINHYVVKKALISNPYTPTQISMSLIHFLLEQDLEEVAENMLLHPQVREAALELITIKRKKQQEEAQDKPEL